MLKFAAGAPAVAQIPKAERVKVQEVSHER